MDYADLGTFADNGLLTAEATTLTAGQLQAEAELAIDLLGFADASFADDDLAKATRAVALQVNHQRALDGVGFALASDRRGRRSRSFRSAGLRLISPVAASIAYALMGGDDWATVTSLR